MKIRHSLILFLMVSLCFSSCDKSKDAIFEMDLFFDINVPAGLNTLETHFFIIEDVQTFSSTIISNNNEAEDNIGSILGATANLQTRFSGLDLDFIEDIGIHILDKDDHTKRHEAFYILNDVIPFGSKTNIDMLPSIVDLKKWLLDETVDIEFRINFRGFLPQEIDGRIEMKYFAYPPE